MIGRYKFEETDERNCFEDGEHHAFYFPVKDSMDFPKEIRDKTEEMIDSLVYAYELENNCTLDLSKLRLDARLETFADHSGNWLNEILVVISGSTAFDDIWIEGEYTIGRHDPLYKPFMAYFMEQIERKIFQ